MSTIKIKKTNKYSYRNVIQQYFTGSYGWEDVSEYEAKSNGVSLEKTKLTVISKRIGLPIKIERSLCSLDFKQYQLTGYPTRIIFRRELNN